MDGDTGMLRHLNTAQVVEDIVAIIKERGKWKGDEVTRSLQQKEGRVCDACEAKSTTAITEAEKLQYWGVSYGSVLGATFASMHPGMVGRIIIDGIVDPDDYYNTDWLTNLQDSDKVFSKMCEYCFEAGPGKCGLWTAGSGMEVEKRIRSFKENLKDNPMSITAEDDIGPDITTYVDVLSNLGAQGAFHDPLHKGAEFFATIAQLINGTTKSFARKK